MGEVYEGVQKVLKRRVAIKLLAGWAVGRADVTARFLREGETAARIRHRNIVEIYDVGMWDERPYMVMEYLEGRTFEEMLRFEAPMAEAEAVDIMLPVMSAVGAANDRGIVHRDLKPENIFIAQTDAGREPKVLDFGISRVVTSRIRHTVATEQLGTPHFMSPEQARGEADDVKTDQYAIGVVLFYALTGELPRDHEDTLKLIRMVGNDPPKAIRELAPNLSQHLEQVIVQAMAPKPEDRYSDIQDMMRAILPLASDRTRGYWESELNARAPSGERSLDKVAASERPTLPSTPAPGPPRNSSPAEPQAGHRGPVLAFLLLLGAVGAGWFWWSGAERGDAQDASNESRVSGVATEEAERAAAPPSTPASNDDFPDETAASDEPASAPGNEAAASAPADVETPAAPRTQLTAEMTAANMSAMRATTRRVAERQAEDDNSAEDDNTGRADPESAPEPPPAQPSSEVAPEPTPEPSPMARPPGWTGPTTTSDNLNPWDS